MSNHKTISLPHAKVCSGCGCTIYNTRPHFPCGFFVAASNDLEERPTQSVGRSTGPAAIKHAESVTHSATNVKAARFRRDKQGLLERVATLVELVID